MSLLETAVWWHVYPLGACGAPIRPGDLGHPDGHDGQDGHVDDHDAGRPATDRLDRLVDWLDYAVELGCSGLLLGPVFHSSTHGYDTLDHVRVDPRLGDDAALDRLLAACRERGLAVLFDGVFNHVGARHRLVVDGSPLIRREGDGTPAGWEGHTDLAEFDHTRPEVAELVSEVMLHWLRRGIAGWRLDVAYAVPSSFWRQVAGRVRAEFPDALLLGEVIHGDYAAIAQAGTLDSITQYELWKAIRSSISDRNLWELAAALDRHADFSRALVLNTFVGNHDVDRIAEVVGDDGAALAAAVLLTLPGMPSIYYGDEQAFRGARGEGVHADDPVRPPLPDTPAGLSPQGAWLYELHQRVIGFRRRHGWLARSQVRVVERDNLALVYECSRDGHSVRVELALDPVARVHVRADDGEELTWTAAG